MDQGQQRQLIRLAKKLFPKVLRWWKKRQSGQQSGGQQSGGSSGLGGIFGGNQSSGPWQGGYNNQQFPQGQSGPPSYPIQQTYSPASHGPTSGAGYGQPSQYISGAPPLQQHGHQINHDMVNASDPRYTELRNAAIREGDLMHKCFDGASKAHNAGDGARAKQLSNEGHEHQNRQRELNAQASQLIYSMNNSHSTPGEIDLHGLYVQEALHQTETAIQQGQQRGDSQLIVITGKGLHSTAHVARIKPAIEDLMRKYQLEAHVDPHNAGRLIVNLRGRQPGGQRDLGFVDQLDQAAGKDQCTIM